MSISVIEFIIREDFLMDTKKKVIITTATMAAAVTTGAIATTAHADQVNANVNTNTNTQTTQGQSDLKTAQDQSRQNYADAKSANDAAQADLNNAKSANINAENQQTAASAQEAQDAIAQQNAQDSVNAASDALAQAQSDAAKTASDPAAMAKAQSDANAASQANSQAQADLNQASENVKTAQDQAGKAQASVNQAQDQVTQANNNVKTASDAVSQAQTDLNNAKSHQQALSDAQQAVTSAQSQKDAADTNVNNAQNDFNSKQSAANSAKTNLDNAKKTLADLKNNDHEPIQQTIQVSSDWINLMKSIQNRLVSPSNTTDMSFTNDEGNQYVQLGHVIANNNHYISDPTQAAIPLHINEDGTLSKNDQIDATRFVVNIVNSIRQQLGFPTLDITENSLEMGTKIAQQYNKDNWNIFPYKIVNGELHWDLNDPHLETHDQSAIYNNGGGNEAASEGIHTVNYKIPGDDMSDAVSITYPKNWATNRDQLHQELYNDIIGWIFEDGHQPEHAEVLLSLHTTNANIVSSHASIQFDKYNQIHFNIEKDQPDNSAVISLNNNSSSNNANQIKSAQTAVNNAQSAYDAAQTALAQAQTALDQAKSSQASAQSKLAEAQTNLQRVQAETPSVDDAQAKLTAAQNKLASAKQMAQNAQKALENAQATKANADHALAQAENTLAGAKTKAANAQVDLKQANDKLNAVLGANKKIEDAQTKLDAAKAALQVAKSNHDTSAKKLSEAKDAVKAAQDNLAKAQAHANATAKALANAKEALITDAKVYHDSVSIKPVTIHKGESVPAPEIANPMAQDPTQSLVMGTYLKLAASKLDTIPTGTTAAWSNKAQLANDAQIVGNHQEGATVTFPDGSTMTLNVPLVVLDTETPVTPTNPGKPDQGKTDDHGTTPTPSKPDQGKTDGHKGDDSHTTTPGNPTTPSKPSDNSHVTTPKGDTKTDTTTNTTLPSDAHVVNSQVVNAQGQVIPGFKVENGTIVATNNSATTASVNTTAPVASATTMTREQYRASQNNKSNTDAKTLPQTGNHNQAGLVGLGIATLISMFGLAATNKKY